MSGEIPRQSDHKSGRLESKRAWNIELEQALNEKTAELRQSEGRLRALASELSLAEQRARKRLANELHDHLPCANRLPCPMISMPSTNICSDVATGRDLPNNLT